MNYAQQQFGENAEEVLGLGVTNKLNSLYETLTKFNIIENGASVSDVLDNAVDREILDWEEKCAIKKAIRSTYQQPAL